MSKTHASYRADKRRFAVLIGAPSLIWQLVFFLLPLLFLVMMTFWSVRNFRLQPDFTLANWKMILNAGFFQSAYLYTFAISIFAAAVAAVAAFPVAYLISFRLAPAAQRMLIGLLVIPFFTSLPVRVYSMQIFFSPSGLINSVLAGLGLSPVTVLNTPVGALVGYLTLTIPLVILLQIFALNGVDRQLVEAAYNLRCGKFKTVISIIIPSARVGLVVSFALAFVFAFGDYISPQFLGGSNPPTLSILMADQVKSGNHWPRASVVAMTMIFTLMAMMGILLKFAYGRSAK
ncbi:MAG: ABC transporter permease subunit [Shinella sp.]|jgi:spermidine/putrescine transport system permease protein|nr:ABC transporter permease subunit [Shinella sp.]